METIHGFDFQAIQSDRTGVVTSGADELAAHVRDAKVSDVVLICHGFRNDDNDARRLYAQFMETFAENIRRPPLAERLAGRTLAFGGLFWPSMIVPEPDDSNGSAQSIDTTAEDRSRLQALRAKLDGQAAEKVGNLVSLVDKAPDDHNTRLEMARTLIDLVRGMDVEDSNEVHAALSTLTPEQLCSALMADQVTVARPGTGGGAPGIPVLPTLPGAPGQSVGIGQGLSVFGRVFGFVPKFVNLTTFLLMFQRCGDVGSKGISDVVRRIRQAAPANVRIHLVGHSLGGRAVTACAKALLDEPATHVDTMMLLQAAYSHFGLSGGATDASPIKHPRGHFRDIIEKGVVHGPILATHSQFDSVVQFAYTPMAALILNNAKAIGDEKSPFGGIGRNGVLDTAEVDQMELAEPGVPYAFKSGRIHNLNGSRKIGNVPLIASHGDVKSPAITWAFASLVASA